METRKVQLSGGTTYTVSLPKQWAEEHGVEAGSILHVDPNEDGTLLVSSTHKADDELVATVPVESRSLDELVRTVEALYLVGYDRICLRDPTGNMAGVAHEFTRRTSLSGLEVLEATETKIVFHNLIEARNVSIRKNTIRLNLIVLSMYRDAIDAVVDGDESLARSVIDRDDEADKMFAMISRHFRRSLSNLQEVQQLGFTRDELFEYYYVARQLERVGDHAEKIARLVTRHAPDLSPELVDTIGGMADRSRAVFERSTETVLSNAPLETAYQALDDRTKLVADLEAIDRDLYEHDSAGNAYLAGLLLDSIKRTAEYGANIAEMGIQRERRTCSATE
ncbi:phosphate signaling complex PhoU family protein [Natronorubrum aibiense]|uniref:Phosphate uptake regulator PhoU n=1 Tax=Natronorubrum aibiense TaxID=348826 RepID=A0A5P9P9K6_9EURY|nr:phosphate uptake regulator PhoU [Natronorubrum aibiense]QFU84831.1 phosphate uptake regulator PhoU [Natronorubrum aibiense]